MKTCTSCERELHIENFHKGKARCRECRKTENALFYLESINKEGGRDRWKSYWLTGYRNRTAKKPKRIRRVRVVKLRPMRLRFRVLNRCNFACVYCGRKSVEAKLQIDHVIPKSKGGTNEESNLVAACWECNIGKGDVLLNS